MDSTLPARVQFALTISYHWLYPPISIGLGLIMVILGVLYLRTHNPVWNNALRFWTRIYALNFALGIATGLVQEFQFGTNWSSYSRFVGDVFGSALAAEGIFAFFLESGFLGVMLFAGDRISARMQVFATFMEDPVGLRERHHIGIDNIMWASDYPHSETTWPNSKALTDEWLTPFGDEDKAKILWENCARLYGLL